jgi:hypothetical protein
LSGKNSRRGVVREGKRKKEDGEKGGEVCGLKVTEVVICRHIG